MTSSNLDKLEHDLRIVENALLDLIAEVKFIKDHLKIIVYVNKPYQPNAIVIKKS